MPSSPAACTQTDNDLTHAGTSALGSATVQHLGAVLVTDQLFGVDASEALQADSGSGPIQAASSALEGEGW